MAISCTSTSILLLLQAVAFAFIIAFPLLSLVINVVNCESCHRFYQYGATIATTIHLHYCHLASLPSHLEQ
jgi:hypothetical protein